MVAAIRLSARARLSVAATVFALASCARCLVLHSADAARISLEIDRTPCEFRLPPNVCRPKRATCSTYRHSEDQAHAASAKRSARDSSENSGGLASTRSLSKGHRLSRVSVRCIIGRLPSTLQQRLNSAASRSSVSCSAWSSPISSNLRPPRRMRDGEVLPPVGHHAPAPADVAPCASRAVERVAEFGNVALLRSVLLTSSISPPIRKGLLDRFDSPISRIALAARRSIYRPAVAPGGTGVDGCSIFRRWVRLGPAGKPSITLFLVPSPSIGC